MCRIYLQYVNNMLRICIGHAWKHHLVLTYGTVRQTNSRCMSMNIPLGRATWLRALVWRILLPDRYQRSSQRLSAEMLPSHIHLILPRRLGGSTSRQSTSPSLQQVDQAICQHPRNAPLGLRKMAGSTSVQSSSTPILMRLVLEVR